MKEPGFSTARTRPVKLGPLMKVASVMEARSLTSPALTATVAAAPPFLSMSYLPFKAAFIVNNGVAATNTRLPGCICFCQSTLKGCSNAKFIHNIFSPIAVHLSRV